MCSVCTCRTGTPVQVCNVRKYNTHKMLHNPKIKQRRPECFPNTSHLQIVVLICTEVTGTSDSSGSCFDSFSNQEPEFLRSWVNKKNPEATSHLLRTAARTHQRPCGHTGGTHLPWPSSCPGQRSWSWDLHMVEEKRRGEETTGRNIKRFMGCPLENIKHTDCSDKCNTFLR